MSLHKFADMVAKQGRGDDSLLVHMTPDEVSKLQQFAQANGHSLTINPHTGLPEAGILSDFFKAVAPVALGAFLGPAGFGLSATMAGVATGGITALATGSLSRGLMAGLGAYGGAGLGESLAGAGTGALASQITGEVARDKAAEIAAGQLGEEEVGKMVSQRLADTSAASKMGAGLGAITDSGSAAMQFAKQNVMPLAAAAAPIMAGAMVPTTTKMPENTNPAYIRQKLYDPYTQTYKSLAPVRADQWGTRNFSDAYTNPQTGQMATLDVRKPSPMASGGIVALAIGGDTKAALEQAYAANDVAKINDIVAQNKITAEDVGGTWAGFDTSGIKGLNLYTPPAQQAAPAYTAYTPEQIGSYLTTNPNADIAKATKDFNADPAAVNAYISSLAGGYKDPTATVGGSGTLGIYNQLKAAGIDAGELYNAQPGGWSQADIQRQMDFDKGAYGLAAALPKGVSDKDWAQWMDANNYSVLDAAKAFGLSVNEVQRRYDAAKKEEKKVTTPVTTTTVVPGGTQLPGATVYDNGAFGNYGSGPATGVDYLGRTVSIATPGDIITNPDQSRTVVPNLPGRPYGGFTGMDQVKSAYTAGGGSLGYTAKAPRTMAEFDQLYNKQTGDSLAAYDYLMGKGAGKYPIQSTAAAGPQGIMRPYWSAGMKYKPKFLTQNADGTVSSSDTRGGTTGTTTADLTKAKSIYVLDSQGNSVEATLGTDGNYHTSSGESYDVSGAPVVAKASGGMAYAMGGGLGSLGSYSDGGRLLKGPGDGVSDSIPATIGANKQPARLADGEFVVPARIVSELGNGSTEAGARKLYAMMDRVQRARGKTTGKNKVAANTNADKHLPA